MSAQRLLASAASTVASVFADPTSDALRAELAREREKKAALDIAAGTDETRENERAADEASLRCRRIERRIAAAVAREAAAATAKHETECEAWRRERAEALARLATTEAFVTRQCDEVAAIAVELARRFREWEQHDTRQRDDIRTVLARCEQLGEAPPVAGSAAIAHWPVLGMMRAAQKSGRRAMMRADVLRVVMDRVPQMVDGTSAVVVMDVTDDARRSA